MTATMPEYTISKRVRGVWKKFSDWYGADNIAKNFGSIPTEEWCNAIDQIQSRDSMTKILADIRLKHTTFPPRFPEFEAIVRAATLPAHRAAGPSMQDVLTSYVLKHKRLTFAQVNRPWKFIGRSFDAPDANGKMRANHGVEIIGVEVPADGDAPGHRVMVEDMQLAQDQAA